MDTNDSLLGFTLGVGLLIGAFVFVLMYILRALRGETVPANDNRKQDHKNDNAGDQQVTARSKNATNSANSAKNRKKTSENQHRSKLDKQSSFEHHWLITTLKGHSSQVLDMDLSSNGKYLVSCADEDPDPGGHHHHHHDGHADDDNNSSSPSNHSSSSSDSNTSAKDTSSNSSSGPPSADPSPRTSHGSKGLSRRQRKNRKRDDTTTTIITTATVETTKKTNSKPKVPEVVQSYAGTKKTSNYIPLKQFSKLDLTEEALITYLRTYLLSYEQMLSLGYPMESSEQLGHAMIFKNHPNSVQSLKTTPADVVVSVSRFDVNAREFIPRKYEEDMSSNSSGHGSGNSSDSGEIIDDMEDAMSSSSTSSEELVKNSGSKRRLNYKTTQCVSAVMEHSCVRCKSPFLLSSNFEYVTQEKCRYHWGKLQLKTNSKLEYVCCHGGEHSSPCTVGPVHVWSGLQPGFNGPYPNYARTRTRRTHNTGGGGVYAVDCEMCYTAAGLELARVTVVAADGRLVYDSFVRPAGEILDYNTRFSGITARDLSQSKSKTLREVQNDLMGFVSADTILVGHGLENDLRALKMLHGLVVDTAVAFPHYNGLPYRRSLKSLTGSLLRREIQTAGCGGHNSWEDARAAMELMLWRVRKDFRKIIDHYSQQERQQHQGSLETTRAVMVWDIKDLTQNAHRSLRINVDFDYATLAKFSPDSKAIVINKYSANSTEVYKLEKKKDGWLANGNKSVTFPKVHDGDVISIGISCNGKFLMSASNKTDIVLFDLKGQRIGNVDTYLINNCCAKISPCGRFIAASGFTPDVVVWEVLFNKSGDFQEIKKAFTLVGHTSGVYDIAFDTDTSHMATVSKDGTWKLYDTKIDYKRGENPHLKISTKYESSSGSNSTAKIALSPNAEVLALSTNDTLTMYYTDDGLVDCEITGLPAVSQLLFDSTGKHLYLSSDRHIRVFHNVTGYTSSINTAREKLKQNQTSATKERLHEIIRDSEKFLKDFIQN